MTNSFPVAWLDNFDIRSKYTRRLRNTSFVVGQYLRMRKRYASREMVGMLRAWNVRVEDGVEREVREALVSDFQSGVLWSDAGLVIEGDSHWVGELVESLSLVAAICVRREA